MHPPLSAGAVFSLRRVALRCRPLFRARHLPCRFAVPSEPFSVVVARVLGSSLPSRRLDALRVFRQAPTASPLKVGGFSLGLGARSGDPRCPQEGPVAGSVRPRTCPTVETVVPSGAPPMGFRPAQRVSAGQLTACWRAPAPLAGSRHGPGSQSRASPITTFLRSSWGVPNLPRGHFQTAPAHRVCPSEPFSPEHPSNRSRGRCPPRRCLRRRRPPSRGCEVPRSRTVTSPCCRRRQAVALLGVFSRPRGCPFGRPRSSRLAPTHRGVAAVRPPSG